MWTRARLGKNGDSRFHECLDIRVLKVNPRTKEYDSDERRNRTVRIWLECGPYLRVSDIPREDRAQLPDGVLGMTSHSIRLDCGGKTFEEAIIKLANLVISHFGTDRSKVVY